MIDTIALTTITGTALIGSVLSTIGVIKVLVEEKTLSSPQAFIPAIAWGLFYILHNLK